MTTVTILNPPVGIKPGLTAEVRIVVNEIPNALQLPAQAVFEHGGKHYAVTYHDGKWDKVEIVVGPNNDKHIVILEGLKENDFVVLGSRTHRDKIDLPKIQEQEPEHNRGLLEKQEVTKPETSQGEAGQGNRRRDTDGERPRREGGGSPNPVRQPPPQ